MRLLLLGGTAFLGKHIAEAALAAGHDVTLFHRGQHGRDLFPSARHVFGDRDGGLGALAGQRCDAVIDSSGYLPRVVRQSVQLSSAQVSHYTFFSSINAYESLVGIGVAEDAPLAQLPSEAEEDVSAWYGALKARCEMEVRERFADRSLLIRPGLIVGPDDPSDRVTYRVARGARDGEMLAPGRPGRPVQVMDVRDLAAWTLSLVERGASGAYNAAGPEDRLTMAEALATCREAGQGHGPTTWVTDEFLAAHGVAAWTEMPLYIPESEPDAIGFESVSIRKALTAGLSLRPLHDTVRDTLAWDRSRPADMPRRSGINPAREQELLVAWHSSAPQGT